jgi:hypothetical protein
MVEHPRKQLWYSSEQSRKSEPVLGPSQKCPENFLHLASVLQARFPQICSWAGLSWVHDREGSPAEPW